MLFTDGKPFFSRNYLIHLVDRIGGGDSFSAGLLYGVMNNYASQDIIEFATAASCLKQSMEMDFNLATVQEVQNLVKGDGSGRVQR
jgi:2-dehydro-3-deoxygluconokinase